MDVPSDSDDAPAAPRGPLHPDDLPPDPDARRAVPRGLLWAAALFVVVLTIASFVALSGGSNKGSASSSSSGGDVVHLDPNAPQPPDTFSNGLTGLDLTGKPAPDATFPTFTGAQQSIKALEGKPLVVNFWASSCTACIGEMPDLEKLHQHYGDKVTFVGIDTVDGETPGDAMAQRTGVTYELGRDPNGTIAKSFGLVNLPTTVLIGRDGKVVASGATQTYDSLSALIDQHLQP